MDSSPAGHVLKARPLVVTGDLDLLEEILQLADAARVEVDVATDADSARRMMDGAPLAIVADDDVGRTLARAPIPQRSGLVLLGCRPADEEGIWRRALDLGAEHVVFLPEARQWLIDRLAHAVSGAPPDGSVVCVVGGRGGAGASTLAVALAITATRHEVRTTLIDADPLAGGLEGLLPLRDDLASEHARSEELNVLSWDFHRSFDIPVTAMRAALSTSRRESGLVVVDLPRRLDDAARLACRSAATTLLVVPGQEGASAAAARVAAQLRGHCADVRVVVRVPTASDLSAVRVIEELDLPLAGQVSGEPYEFCASFLKELGIRRAHRVA